MRLIELVEPQRLLAPAKVNLGLEVLGRRPDGYHTVVTIMQAIDLVDRIMLTPAPAPSYEPPVGLNRDDDLLWRALLLAEAEFGVRLGATIRLEKQIPMAAGLGGGSSDAGTLFGAIARLADLPLPEVEAAAARLGSDVPFFVRGGTALATGTGTELAPLPTPANLWFVIVVPPLEIPGKTATLYRSLRPDDFSDGQATQQLARQLERREPIDPELLRNSFTRPLRAHAAVLRAAEALEQAGATVVLPSGAGPSLFTVTSTRAEADAIAAQLSPTIGQVFVAKAIGAD